MIRPTVLPTLANHFKASPLVGRELIAPEYFRNISKLGLNRHKALNTLNLELVKSLNEEVQKLNHTSEFKATIFSGNGCKAFCAGGDIKSLYEVKKQKNMDWFFDIYFQELYSLINNVAEMKPAQIVFMDGITFGGGVGLSANAPIKIATERCVLSMPEAKIGYFTDVGSGYFLSRLRNHLGCFLGLTGMWLKAEEVVQVGLADFFVLSDKLKFLEQELLDRTNKDTSVEDLRAIVQKYAEPVANKYANEEFINDVFSKGSVEEIYSTLQNTQQNKEYAQSLLKRLDLHAPLSMKVIFEQLQRGKSLNLRENLMMDRRVTARFMQGSDFFEGVRCTLIDKNDKPNWSFESVEEVPNAEVQRYFEKLPDGLELRF